MIQTKEAKRTIKIRIIEQDELHYYIMLKNENNYM